MTQDFDFTRVSGSYFGQKEACDSAKVFAPGIVSTKGYELNSFFSPDGTEFYFCRYTKSGVKIYYSSLADGFWEKPEQIEFCKNNDGIDVTISPDGSKLFFSSIRPVHVDSFQNISHDFWMSVRNGKKWSDPVHLGEKINTKQEDFFPCSINDGTLYFSSQREGAGTNNIYRSKLVNGIYDFAEKLDSNINTAYRDYDPYIAPDESILIFASERPGGFGGSDLYISYRGAEGTWTKAKNLGEIINTPAEEYSPTISPDGKYLFFTRTELSGPGSGINVKSMDIYWIDIKAINKFKQQ